MPNHLKKIRQDRGLVIYGLVTLSGVSPSIISAVEKHDYRPSPDTRTRIAEPLGVPMQDIWPSEDEQLVTVAGV